jgi:hypothetical protein
MSTVEHTRQKGQQETVFLFQRDALTNTAATYTEFQTALKFKSTLSSVLTLNTFFYFQANPLWL